MGANQLHDPFRIILKGCLTQHGIQVDVEENRIFEHDSDCELECTCIEPDELVKSFFNQMKPFVRSLRQKFKGEGISIDYADANFRHAYMLAYYPYYINPVFQTLKDCNYCDLIDNKTDLHTCCFGGGPLPELIGISKYVNAFLKDVWIIDCTVFDYNKEWKDEREIYTLNLAGHYYNGLINLHDKFIDLWDPELIAPDEVRTADLVLFQNCFNDCPLDKYEALKQNVTAIWDKMSSGSIMIIIDLTYGSIANLLRNIETLVENMGGKILKPVQYNDVPLKVCTLMKGRLFDGSDGLIPRYHSNYWSLAMRKM